MKSDAPDLREFCFSPEAPLSPDMMLAVWARKYLTDAQFQEFRRLVKETIKDGVNGTSVEQMIGILEMAKFLAD